MINIIIILLLLSLLRMMLISRSMDLWKISCIFFLYSIDKLSFSSILVFSFLFQLPIFSSDSQIFKELCSSSSYSFLPSSLLQWHFEDGNLFSEYDQPNWIFYLGYCLELSYFLLHVQKLVHQYYILLYYYQKSGQVIRT